jgi:hypothetical protein
MPFVSNIFINCPFDKDYSMLLKSMVFTTIYLGLEPILSQTTSSSNIRANQIKQHIKSCKYGIHDLSRSKAMNKGEFPRINMPYELGLDIGAQEYGGKVLKSKKILILETEKYHYQKVLSDIAGQDIENHNDEPEVLVQKIRDWMSNNTKNIIVGHSEIWNAYNQFNDDLYNDLINSYTNTEIEFMQIGDYIKFAKDWIKSFRNS